MSRLLTIVTVMVAVLTTSITACGSDDDGLTRTREVIGGETTLSIVDETVTTRGVVVFFHGLDQDESLLDADEPHRELVRELCAAGYAVVASRAGGNAYGNSASQRAHSELAKHAARRHRVSDVFFLAESMGTIAAVNLMAKQPELRVRGLAAIGPALNFTHATDEYLTGLLGANDDVAGTDPMGLPPESLRGRNFRFYASPEDTLVPTSSNALEFRSRFGAVANISIVECRGSHLNSSCLDGKDVVSWFTTLAAW